MFSSRLLKIKFFIFFVIILTILPASCKKSEGRAGNVLDIVKIFYFEPDKLEKKAFDYLKESVFPKKLTTAENNDHSS